MDANWIEFDCTTKESLMPAIKLIALPPSVYEAPDSEIELKVVPAGKSLVLFRRAAPAGNSSESAGPGATLPTQFAASVQLLVVPPPSQVRVEGTIKNT